MENSRPYSPNQVPMRPTPPKSVTLKNTKIDPTRNPDMERVLSVILKDGPRVRKTAKYQIIRDRHTGEPHHDALSVITHKKSKTGLLSVDPDHSVSLSSAESDEIQPLVDLLLAGREKLFPGSTGRMVVAHADSEDKRQALLKLLDTVSETGEYNLIVTSISKAAHNPALFAAVLERAAKDPKLFAEAAAALNLAAYKAMIQRLHALIEGGDESESAYQRLLADNPWMFGSEYSELLQRRRWTRDENLDFVLRRTTDGYVELIEIKTPLNGRPLFLLDASHNSYYASSELSKVVGQVQKYIERLDAERNSIIANDHEDTAKIRAKVIVGRDLGSDHVAALRRFNGHLHRIEVITFDQLARIAERVVSYLEQAIRPGDNSYSSGGES